MASIALGLASLIGPIVGSVIGANASKTAATQQVDAANQALDFQKLMFGTAQANQAPFLQAGQQSIGDIMKLLASGKFGPGSLGAVPEAPGAFTGKFTAPTLEEARATPGYEFTREQGEKGVLQGAAAAGGAISGGTLKALDQYGSGLADTTYNDRFNQALQTFGTDVTGYQTNLQRYAAQLGGFQTAQGAQAQEFSQLFAPAQLGEGAVQNINNTGTQTAFNAGNLMTQIGNANAAGTVGSANAINNGISGATNGLFQSLLFNKLFSAGGGSAPNINPSDLMRLGITTPALGAGIGPG